MKPDAKEICKMEDSVALSLNRFLYFWKHSWFYGNVLFILTYNGFPYF